MKYRVGHLQSDTYQVTCIRDSHYDGIIAIDTLFQGSLSDCEAWIRLKQNENVDF